MPKPTDIYVGKQLRAQRVEKGFTQTTLAKKLGLSFQQVQKYETGANRVSASKMWDLGRILGVRPEYFFDGLGTSKGKRSADTSAKADSGEIDELQAELNRYFMRIKDPRKRRQVVYLVRSIAEVAGKKKPADTAKAGRKAKRR